MGEWQNVVFVDESTIEYNPYPVGGRIRIRAGEELEEKNLKASFKSGRTNVGICAAIAYGRQTKLIKVHKCTPAEHVSATDRLGLNAAQYATELH